MNSPAKIGLESSPSRFRWRFVASLILGFWACTAPHVCLASDEVADRRATSANVGADPQSGRESSDRAVAIHAAGAVTMSFPTTWTVHEVPVRREIRLVLRPNELRDSEQSAANRVEFWLSYHHQSGLGNDAQQLRRFAKNRVAAITRGRLDIDDLRATSIDSYPAIQVTFHYELMETNRIARYIAAVAPWGHVELQTSTLAEDWAGHEGMFSEIVNSIRLAQPSVSQRMVVGSVHDASPILGSWKSYRGRMRLVDDGRVEIVADQAFSYESTEGTTETSKKIIGQFRAQQDLLFIEWADGSQLNFRWRLAGNRLLLTDHNGRMTQLHVILE